MLRFIVAMGTATVGQVEGVVTNAHAGPSAHTVAAAHPLPREYQQLRVIHDQIDLLGSKEFTDREAAHKFLLERKLSHNEFLVVAAARHFPDAEIRNRSSEIFKHHRHRFENEIIERIRTCREKFLPVQGGKLPWLNLTDSVTFPQWFTPLPSGAGSKVQEMYVAQGFKNNVPCDTVHLTNYFEYTRYLVEDVAPLIVLQFYGRDDLMNSNISYFQKLLDDMSDTNEAYCDRQGKERTPRWRPKPEPKKELQQRQNVPMSRNDTYTTPFDVVAQSRTTLKNNMEPAPDQKQYYRGQRHRG